MVLVMDLAGRWPVVHAHDQTTGAVLGEWRTDTAEPDLDVLRSCGYVALIDILEHVLDEEYWLATIRDLIVPAGTITIRVPAEGQLSWLDSLNMYRYIADLTGRGQEPRITHPTGWHRHYRRSDLVSLVERSGFTVGSVTRTGLWHREPMRLVRLLKGDLQYDHLGVARRLFGTPADLTFTEPTIPGGRIGARWLLEAARR